MEYTNTPLDTSPLIELLKERELNIADEQKASDFLENVSYFRFASYLRPFEEDSVEKRYKPTATFEKAVDLYRFDARLRVLLFSAIQQIEISLRSRLINKFSLAHGAFWFIEPSLSVDKHKYADNLVTLERELGRSKDDFIKDHYAKYGKEGFPPSWKLLELASFGCLTKLYFNFTDIPLKKKIARSYGVPQHEILESWMKSINALRNACAHHSRVWNRIMPVMPKLPSRLRHYWLSVTPATANRLYSVLSCLLYWLNAVNPSNTLKQDFKNLLTEYPNVDVTAMGFPSNWLDQPLWRS